MSLPDLNTVVFTYDGLDLTLGELTNLLTSLVEEGYANFYVSSLDLDEATLTLEADGANRA